MPASTSSGRRLAQLGGGALPRTNVIQRYPGRSGKGAAFPLDEARVGLARLRRRTPLRVAFVYVGKRVAAADGWRGPYLQWGEHRGRLVATLPHPSGINQWWNDPANVELAGRFVSGLGGARTVLPVQTSQEEDHEVTPELRTHFKIEVNEAVRRSLPQCGACRQPLGSCLDTCEAFGVGEEHVAGSNTRRWSDSDLGGILRSMGGAVSRKAYAAERRRLGGSIPAESSVMRRFGSWQGFLDACLESA
jgi:hypothetical protein